MNPQTPTTGDLTKSFKLPNWLHRLLHHKWRFYFLAGAVVVIAGLVFLGVKMPWKTDKVLSPVTKTSSGAISFNPIILQSTSQIVGSSGSSSSDRQDGGSNDNQENNSDSPGGGIPGGSGSSDGGDPDSNPPASGCALPKYPTDECTGVPAGTVLSQHTGNLDVDEEGAVIENMRITGRLRVRALNVTIRNVEVWGRVEIGWLATASYTIEDSTIGRGGVCMEHAAVSGANYTARRVRTKGYTDGFFVNGSNVTIEDSYSTMCQIDCHHSDGIQAFSVSDADNIILRHNVMDMRAVTDPCATTCPIFIPTDQNPGVSASIFDNVMAGGENGLCLYGNSSGASFPNVTGNKVVDNTWEYNAFGLHPSQCSIIGVWSGNSVVNYDFATGTILNQVRTVSCAQASS